MTIGEVARRAGVTVRALRHYDRIGLLRPSGRNASNYRTYEAEDIARLHHIRVLQQLGLSLVEIGRLLDDPGFSPQSLVEMQLARLDRQIEMLQRLRGRVAHLRSHLHHAGGASSEAFLESLEVMAMLDKHYTPEQLEWLQKRHEEVGDARIRQVEDEWKTLYASFDEHRRAGRPVTDAEVQKLVSHAKSLIAEFTGGNPEIAKSLDQMYADRAPAQSMLRHHGYEVDDGLWNYVGAAMKASK